MALVVPWLVGFISSVDLPIMNAYLRTLLERHNVLWLTKSKVGLAILTMILSRGEISRQTSIHAPDLQQW